MGGISIVCDAVRGIFITTLCPPLHQVVCETITVVTVTFNLLPSLSKHTAE